MTRISKHSMTGAELRIPARKSMAMYLTYVVSTKLLKKRTDTNECEVYEHVYGYANCVEDEYIKMFNNLLGCYPFIYSTFSNKVFKIYFFIKCNQIKNFIVSYFKSLPLLIHKADVFL